MWPSTCRGHAHKKKERNNEEMDRRGKETITTAAGEASNGKGRLYPLRLWR